ncbi:hypothetical protein KY340_03760 [Candidatus Woesearchaeota archaeon]|nr:hypothetical protein [Candidatus Woesearchaeota archaeon]
MASTLEKITDRKEKIDPVVEKAMEKFLGATVKQVNEDISNRLIEGFIDFDIDLSVKFKKAKEQFKHAYLIKLLQFTNGNISEAARIAGVDRRSIHRLISRFKIDITKLRKEPYYFREEKKEMYVKEVVEETLGRYDITKEYADKVDEETAKNISKKIPDVRLTFDEAIDMFEREYIKAALEKFKNIKVAAKEIGIRYETLHKKAKELGLR